MLQLSAIPRGAASMCETPSGEPGRTGRDGVNNAGTSYQQHSHPLPALRRMGTLLAVKGYLVWDVQEWIAQHKIPSGSVMPSILNGTPARSAPSAALDTDRASGGSFRPTNPMNGHLTLGRSGGCARRWRPPSGAGLRHADNPSLRPQPEHSPVLCPEPPGRPARRLKRGLGVGRIGRAAGVLRWALDPTRADVTI
jgi:hypothetical protein